MRIISFNYIEHDICKQRSQNAENSPPDTEKCRLNRVQTAFFDREIMRRTLSNVLQLVQRSFHLPPLQYRR
ncbi:hypothetical protein B1A90_06245 [Neisseria meningitidis]|nr:hypothetical protein B1A90_06245 [Neisseria meningitidis]